MFFSVEKFRDAVKIHTVRHGVAFECSLKPSSGRGDPAVFLNHINVLCAKDIKQPLKENGADLPLK